MADNESELRSTVETAVESSDARLPDITMVRTSGNKDVLKRIDLILPNVRVRDVVDDPNRNCTASLDSSAPFPHLTRKIRWNDDDTESLWVPQGITGSADAYSEGQYEGRKVVLVGWYDHLEDDVNKGARVSFVDVADPENPVYRHVLLVEAYRNSSGHDDIRSVGSVHAGGLVWYGNLLYVASTNHIRVFDLRHLWRVETDHENPNHIGRGLDGKYYAYDYKYVLPQAFKYNPEPSLRCSFISLDRTTTPDSILIGEYQEPPKVGRLLRWNIDSDSRELSYDAGSRNRATSDISYALRGIFQMQGAVSVKDTVYINCDVPDPESPIPPLPPPPSGVGRFVKAKINGNAKKYLLRMRKPQDLYYDAVNGWLWTQNEPPDERRFGTIPLK